MNSVVLSVYFKFSVTISNWNSADLWVEINGALFLKSLVYFVIIYDNTRTLVENI